MIKDKQLSVFVNEVYKALDGQIHNPMQVTASNLRGFKCVSDSTRGEELLRYAEAKGLIEIEPISSDTYYMRLTAAGILYKETRKEKKDGTAWKWIYGIIAVFNFALSIYNFIALHFLS